MLKIIEMPKVDKPGDEYVMGIDPYGYDKATMTICVMKKSEGKVLVQYLNSFRDEKYYEKNKKKNKFG